MSFIETIEKLGDSSLTLRARMILDKLSKQESKITVAYRAAEDDYLTLCSIEACFEKAIASGNPIVINAMRQKLSRLKDNNLKVVAALNVEV